MQNTTYIDAVCHQCEQNNITTKKERSNINRWCGVECGIGMSISN